MDSDVVNTASGWGCDGRRKACLECAEGAEMETRALWLNILMTPHGDAFAAESEVVVVCRTHVHSSRMDGPEKHCKSLDLRPFFFKGRYTSCGGSTAKTSTSDA